MKNDKLYIATNLSFYYDDKILPTLNKVYKYQSENTNMVYEVDKKIFKSLHKQAQETFLEKPIQWALHRYRQNKNNHIKAI